ncbi:MAG: Mrp/NBP35 family ATP-binding protein [Candidatus Marsarchaeota archaeon]|nr:Mrp/NBP35 family ATP-binding protein [Candidatus Marsarchaeota archaeon]
MNSSLTKDAVTRVLKKVNDPEIGENIVDLGMVKGVEVSSDGSVGLVIALTVPECPLTKRIRESVNSELASLGAREVKLEFTSMTEEEKATLIDKVRSIRGERAGQTVNTGAEASRPSPIGRLDKAGVHNIVAVVSGKGGVGKSSVAALLACELRRRGFRVGVLDADVTGPSIPRLFGVAGKLTTDGKKLFPAESVNGVKIVSMNLLVDSETDATVWRGPIVSGVIRQFYTDVDWGELDYMIVDLPPGTSDAPLTVFQSLPLDGVVVVTSPQRLSKMVVGKAVNMAKTLGVPILGVVQNMAYTTCPNCGSRIELGELGYEGLPILATFSVDYELMRLSDEGRVHEYRSEEVSRMVDRMGESRVRAMNIKKAARTPS